MYHDGLRLVCKKTQGCITSQLQRLYTVFLCVLGGGERTGGSQLRLYQIYTQTEGLLILLTSLFFCDCLVRNFLNFCYPFTFLFKTKNIQVLIMMSAAVWASAGQVWCVDVSVCKKKKKKKQFLHQAHKYCKAEQKHERDWLILVWNPLGFEAMIIQKRWHRCIVGDQRAQCSSFHWPHM